MFLSSVLACCAQGQTHLPGKDTQSSVLGARHLSHGLGLITATATRAHSIPGVSSVSPE